MNKTISILFTIFISLSLFAKSGKIVVSGQVLNQLKLANSITITHLNNKKLLSADLNANGNFSMSTKIEDGYYLLKYGRNTSYIYLYPKDELNIVFDAKNFESTLVFNGRGSIRNNYLIKKSLEASLLTKDLKKFYQVDQATYLKNIENVKNSHLELLSKYDVEDFFKTEEIKSLEYERLVSIQNYKSSYKFYFGEEVTTSDDFYAPIKTLKLDYNNDYIKQPYFRYLANSIWSKRIENAIGVEAMLDVLRDVPLQALAVSLINGLYSKISSDKERAKDYLDLIKQVTKHQPFIEEAEKQYQKTLKYKGLNQGNISPEFSYKNIDEKTINLSDLKGKYVYIDIWATWCVPCIKQIPYLKELEERYHDKNIVFVSISVDKQEIKSSWKQIVTDKQLVGLQLIADKSFDSDFMNAYEVNSIPRFILINPEGRIVDPKAPQPSFNKTKILFDELLN